MGTKNIYDTVKGDKLVSDENYPKAIVKYLESEQENLLQVIDKYKVIVEVGCMEGLHMSAVVEKNKFYVGIDIIDRYIENGKKNAQEKGYDNTLFICESAENLGKVQEKILDLGFDKNEIIFFFPFNSFGNMRQINNVVDKLKNYNLNFFISTYKTNDLATKAREEYYLNCNFDNTKKKVEEDKIIFCTDDGFESVTYSKEWFFMKLNYKNHKLEAKDLSEVGQGYIFQEGFGGV